MLRHTAPTLMLGKIMLRPPDYYGNTKVDVDLGDSCLSKRTRYSTTLELANGLEDEYNQQVKDYDQYLMLYMFES